MATSQREGRSSSILRRGFAHWQGAARALFPNVTAGLKDEKQEVKLATTAAVIRLSVESRNDK